MDFHTLSPLFSHAGAAEWGMCAFADLELSTDQLEKAQVLCPTPAGPLQPLSRIPAAPAAVREIPSVCISCIDIVYTL